MSWIKKPFILQFIGSAFIFLFVYTALSKLHEFNQFKTVLEKSPLIGQESKTIAWVLPTVELLAAGFLFIPKTRRIGFYSACILMIIFTTYVGYMIFSSTHLPCSCGGVIKQMSWRQHLLFNITFTALGLFAIVIDSKYSNPSKRTRPQYPTEYS
jgi:hypothetical protein